MPFSVVAGDDADAAVRLKPRRAATRDYRLAVKPGGLRGARIGILRQRMNAPKTDSEVVAVFRRHSTQ